MNKFKAKRTTIDGITYHSKREGKVCNDLRLLEKAGHIRDLELQPKFEFVVNDIKVGTYAADARYFCSKGWLHVIDVKSPATAKLEAFRLKRNLMKAIYGIDVEVIY